MHTSKFKKLKLSEYIQSLQESATYIFPQVEAHKAIGGSYDSLKLAIYRLLKKRKIVRLCQGLFSIVPIEYYKSGSPPPDWFIDDLMQFHQQPYYVGILTASALHGAAHQQPHEFQVITNKQLRSVLVGQWQIRFYTKKIIEKSSTIKLKTHNGYMNVSTPEATAFDLVRYVKAAGYLQNVTTVLIELSEVIDKNLLVKEAEGIEIAYVQRLGYLLENFCRMEIVSPLHNWLRNNMVNWVPLRPDIPSKGAKKDERWNILINEQIEADL